MIIKAIRSDKVYSKMMDSPIEKRNDMYRYELMKPFEKKWAYYHVPLKASQENGYDVIMASGMLGHLAPAKVDAAQENTIKRLPACFAHEMNHNVRFQFIEWRNDITLGEMIVSEGLAENFAVHLYGEDMVGPWVSKTDRKTLNEYIKPITREALGVQGMDHLNAYLYGDKMAVLQGFTPVGLPYCAGYACGYHLIRHYLKKTGKSIVEATILPAAEILNTVNDFWNDI